MENTADKQTPPIPEDPAAEVTSTEPEELPLEETGMPDTEPEEPSTEEVGIPDTGSEEQPEQGSGTPHTETPPLQSQPEVKKTTALYDEKEEGRCRNCNSPFDSEFCPHCGQTANIKRLTFANWKQNILDAFLSLDGTLVRTFRMLFVRPASMIKEYIMGQRKDYRNPFTLLIILCTIYGAILFSGEIFKGENKGSSVAEVSEELIQEFKKEWNENFPLKPDSILKISDPDSIRAATHAPVADSVYTAGKKPDPSSPYKGKKEKGGEIKRTLSILKALIEALLDSFIARCILMIPFYALFTRLLFRKKARNRYNYTELLFATAFITCQKVTVDLLFLPWEEYMGYDTDWMTFIAYILFPAWVYRGLFDVKWWSAIRKSACIYLLSFIVVLICLLISVLLILYVTDSLHLPDGHR
ncbi:MAG: DUF3667 domain-containing protein [Bacteroides sp.]|nr:DUF3667 domain-containing protein [Bacteroides sp.]